MSWYPLAELMEWYKNDFWNFDLHPLYKLSSAFTEFRYDQSFEEIILSHASHVDFLEVSLLTNNSNATIEEEIEKSITIKKETTTSWSVDITKGINTHAEAGISFGSMFHASASIDFHYSSDHMEGGEHKESEVITYRINKKVTVPSHSSVKIVAYVNQIKDLELPFTAKLEIGAIGPVPNLNRSAFSIQPVDVRSVKALMNLADFNGKGAATEYEDTKSKKMVYLINGMFKGSFGLNTVFDAEPVGATEANRLMDLYKANGVFSEKVKIFK